MTAPKRGMVAGQAIQTQAPSKEYDEGFDRTFGERKVQRGRFVYRDGQMVRVDEDWTDAERRAQTSTEEIEYGGLRATDGADISSRRKRREYMQATGVTDASDFSREYVEGRKKDIQKEQDRQRKTDLVESYKQLKGY